jgi:hypothetical protein
VRAASSTILDVVDNFATAARIGDIAALPGTRLRDFGEEVRSYTQAADVPTMNPLQHPIYLGGWPSANFGTVNGAMLLSSLLYSGQILVKDPLADWFCDEQYLIENKLSARPGHRNEDGTLNIRATRDFLRRLLPTLQVLRPLIEAGVVVLSPSQPLFRREEAAITDLRQQLTERVTSDLTGYLQRFTPADVPVDDNRRGLFLWAGGDKEQQYRDAISSGMLYFAREYTLAKTAGAVYTAPFPHEQFVARHGLSQPNSPSERVVEAVFQSRLPVFQGLTPAVIAKVHDDDAFAGFRAQLHTVYQDLPISSDDAEISAYIRDQENALLLPHLAAAEKAADAGRLGGIKGMLPNVILSLGTGILVDLASATPALGVAAGVGATVAQAIRDNRKRDKSPQVIWNTLVRHHRGVAQELTGVQEQPSSGPAGDPWRIPDTPSMKVTISQGTLLWDGPPLDLPNAPQGYVQGNYRPCDCSSGEKYRFCCMNL